MSDAVAVVCSFSFALIRRRTILVFTLGVTLICATASLTAQTILIPTNSIWRYLDDGSNQGTAWVNLDFDDGDWPAGAAELGYGDDVDGREEATIINYGPDPDHKYITTYFRHSFYVSEAASVSNLTVHLLRDDGGIVYLNGIAVFRSGMPEESIDYLTLAEPPGAAGSDETAFFSQAIDPMLLMDGTNVVAVEIHQVAADSPDLSFDLGLVAETGPPPALRVVRGPYLQTGTPNSVIVRWRTDQPTESVVRYGLQSNNLNSVATDLDPTSEHELKLNGLSPATRYYYSVGTSDLELARGPNYFFLTHPVPGSAKPTRVWVIGDPGTYGTGAGNQIGVRDAYYNFAANRYTDVWLALGDNAYYDGTDADYQRAFFNIYPSLLRKTILWSTIGNHEASADPSTPLTLPYFQIFTLPRNAEAGGVASGTEKYYSFDYANIHFVCLDAMSPTLRSNPNSPMFNWLRADLSANTNNWLIAFWHHPPYSKGSHDSDREYDLTQMRTNALPILESYGVDLVLSGHSHIYERSFLINGHYSWSSNLTSAMIKDSGSGRPSESGPYIKSSTGATPNSGTVYVVAGSSGWATYRTYPGTSHPVMFFDELQVGSLVLDIDGDRLDAKFLRETGAIDDNFTIIKGTASGPLRIVTFQVTGGRNIVCWNSVAGRSYQVLKSTDLGTRNWTPAGAPITASGATTCWSNSLPTGPQTFYQVVTSGN